MKAFFIFVLATHLILKHVEALRGNPTKWAAIGDSWAAGYMSGEPLNDAWSSDCLQFSDSYPRQFNEDLDTRATIEFQDLTCSRASLRQINHIVTQFLSPDVELVSISTGLAFIDIKNLIKNCDEDSTWSCNKFIRKANKFAWGWGLNRFITEIWLVLRNIRSVAPNAVVVWIGYPRFYGSPVSECDPTQSGRKGPKYQKGRDAINDLMVHLTLSVKQIALMKDLLGWVYVRDPDEGFEGHRYCDSEPWLIPYPKPARVGLDAFAEGYLHPTTEGQRHLKDLLKDAWQHSRITERGSEYEEDNGEL